MATTSIPVTARTANRATASVTGSCVASDPTAPTNVLTRNIGNGAIEIAWTAGTGVIQHYDCYIATSPSGVFTKCNTAPVTRTRYKIPNVPFNTTAYVKLKAVDGAGRESPFSALGRDAVAERATTRLVFQGMSGMVVPAGIVLTMAVDGELIALRTLQGGTIP